MINLMMTVNTNKYKECHDFISILLWSVDGISWYKNDVGLVHMYISSKIYRTDAKLQPGDDFNFLRKSNYSFPNTYNSSIVIFCPLHIYKHFNW